MDENRRRNEDGVDNVNDDFELTQEEKMAFQRLPREAEPSRILEERVVKALRDEGILGKRAQRRALETAPSAVTHWFRPWMAVASVAASLVLFASGVFLGHWMGAGSTAQAFIAARDQDAAQLALSIQEAGSDYVAALAALSELRGAGHLEGAQGGAPGQDAVHMEQGREVALGALYAAVYELARMSPEDVDVARVLQILRSKRERGEGRTGEVQDVVWF